MIKKLNHIFYLFMLIYPVTSTTFAFHLEKKEITSFKNNGENHNREDIKKFFHKTNPNFLDEKVITDPTVLLDAAKSTLSYFNSKNHDIKKIIKPYFFDKNIMSSHDAKKTLQFIISTIEQDQQKKSSHKILNTTFLNKNFKFIKWNGDIDSAYKNDVKIPENIELDGKIAPGKIRLTNYAVFILNGSYHKTEQKNTPLYQIIDKGFESKSRFLYTKQEIFNGILDNKKNNLKTLVWLSKEDAETAIMQGTAYVKMPDGKKRYFVVDKNNGYLYDKKIKELKDQKRYWYFKEIKKPTPHMDHGGAVFAGDIYNIGLGKIIAIKYKSPITQNYEIRLGILADAGGALTNNLYQLDFFAGIFKTKTEFKEWIKFLPNTAEAYILVKK